MSHLHRMQTLPSSAIPWNILQVTCIFWVYTWALILGKCVYQENTYILLDVLVCSIAEYFYELCSIYKYKQRVKILSITTQQNI